MTVQQTEQSQDTQARARIDVWGDSPEEVASTLMAVAKNLRADYSDGCFRGKHGAAYVEVTP